MVSANASRCFAEVQKWPKSSKRHDEKRGFASLEQECSPTSGQLPTCPPGASIQGGTANPLLLRVNLWATVPFLVSKKDIFPFRDGRPFFVGKGVGLVTFYRVHKLDGYFLSFKRATLPIPGPFIPLSG